MGWAVQRHQYRRHWHPLEVCKRARGKSKVWWVRGYQRQLDQRALDDALQTDLVATARVVPPEDPPYPQVERRKFSRVQVMEATAAAVLASAVIGTAAGVGWLLVQLPNRLQQLEQNITRILENQDLFNTKFLELEKKVEDIDRRLIRQELR